MQCISGLGNSHPKACTGSYCGMAKLRGVLRGRSFDCKSLQFVGRQFPHRGYLNLEAMHIYEGGYNSIQLGMRMYVLLAQSKWGLWSRLLECRRILEGGDDGSGVVVGGLGAVGNTRGGE